MKLRNWIADIQFLNLFNGIQENSSNILHIKLLHYKTNDDIMGNILNI